jgi:hypothetical protein
VENTFAFAAPTRCSLARFSQEPRQNNPQRSRSLIDVLKSPWHGRTLSNPGITAAEFASPIFSDSQKPDVRALPRERPHACHAHSTAPPVRISPSPPPRAPRAVLPWQPSPCKNGMTSRHHFLPRGPWAARSEKVKHFCDRHYFWFLSTRKTWAARCLGITGSAFWGQGPGAAPRRLSFCLRGAGTPTKHRPPPRRQGARARPVPPLCAGAAPWHACVPRSRARPGRPAGHFTSRQVLRQNFDLTQG